MHAFDQPRRSTRRIKPRDTGKRAVAAARSIGDLSGDHAIDIFIVMRDDVCGNDGCLYVVLRRAHSSPGGHEDEHLASIDCIHFTPRGGP